MMLDFKQNGDDYHHKLETPLEMKRPDDGRRFVLTDIMIVKFEENYFVHFWDSSKPPDSFAIKWTEFDGSKTELIRSKDPKTLMHFASGYIRRWLELKDVE